MATYTPSVPQAAQTISSTQAPIQSNFQAISDLVAVNHTPFGSNAAVPGTHATITFADQSASVPSNPPSGQVNLYNNIGSGSIAELYLQYPTGAPGVPTNPIPITVGSAGGGYTYLPTGIIMQWGIKTASSSGSVITSFDTTHAPFTSAPYAILVTPYGSSTTIYVTAKSTTNFTANISSNGQFSWLAIGI